MTLPDLLALCATRSQRIPAGESCLWIFGPSSDTPAMIALPGPAGGDAPAFASWGRDLRDATHEAGALLPFVPAALVLLMPDPICPYLDGAAINASPAHLPLATAPVNLVGLPTPPGESVAARLLAHARRAACARFN